MMMFWLLAAAVAPSGLASSPAVPLSEARHAIEVGRLEQARIIIGKAVVAGVKGPVIDRLLADLAFESGRMDEAAARYEALANLPGAEGRVIERAGIAALRRGNEQRASRLLERALEQRQPSWEAWNALAVLADRRGDFASADEAYGKAVRLAPRRAEIVNNLGWSLLMRGDWENALLRFEEAARMDSKSLRIANNLELARAALAEDLPRRRPLETDDSWAARLNDVGVAANLRGDNARAIAAFTRAIEARSTWFRRAANNLQIAQSPQ